MPRVRTHFPGLVLIGLVSWILTGGSLCSSIKRAALAETGEEEEGGLETSSTAAARDGMLLMRRPDPMLDLLIDSLDSMLGVMDNKPKFKTVVSLTVDPKRWAPGRRSDSALAAAKDSAMPSDPFLVFDQLFPFKPPSLEQHPRLFIKRNVTGDDASLGNLDWSRSFIRLDNKRPARHGDTCINARDPDVPQFIANCTLDFDLNKADQGDDVAAVVDAESRACADVLLTSLPFVEGALGGIFLVLAVVLVASLRSRKPKAVWTRVPFVDKSQYTEKV